MARKIVIALVFCLGILLFPRTIFAATYYVSVAGNDTNPGTQASPWKTIQKAASTMIAGDTVTVLSGNYSTQRVNVTKSGSQGAPITFQAQTGVTMKGFSVSADYISIKGFTIIDLDDLAVGIRVDRGGYCNIENNTVKYSTMGGISLKGLPANPAATHDCTVINNVLYRNGMFGLEIMGQNHLVEGNDISQTIQHHPCNVTYATVGWLDADAIHFHGGGHTFRGNKIHDIYFGASGYTTGTSCSLANVANLANDYNSDPHIDCFQTFAGDKVVGHDIVIDRNYCNNADQLPDHSLSGKFLQTEGGAYNLTVKNNVVITNLLSIAKGDHDFSILNNTFYGDPTNQYSQGLKFQSGSYNMTVKNNIFAYQENGVGSIFPDSTSTTGLSAGNNCVFRSGGKPWRQPDPGDVWNMNPLFVNESTKDLHLQSNSPCIDKGINLGVTNDFDGNSRPQGAGFDIGAYEYTSVVSTPTIKQGDANGDGFVDEADYSIWLSHFGQAVSGGANVGDFDGSGIVDGVDYTVWLKNYGA